MIHTQLRAFNAVARHGSFSKAAEALAVTQPALSLQVKAIEEAYGVKLFERSGHGTVLTEAGARLFKVSRRLSQIEEHVHDALSSSAGIDSGHLTIAADGPHIVMGLFARFMARHPHVELSVAMGNTGFVRRQLLEGQVDVAILPNVAGHRRIHAIKLYEHRAVVVVALDHAWARRADIDLRELDAQPMLAREAGSNTQHALRAALYHAGVRTRFVLELGSREALCEAVAAGIGIGVIWELEARASARVRALAIRNAAIHSTDFVACLKSERNRRPIKAFFDVAAEAHRQLRAPG
jgi:LysR family transcriptional regulator, low CO2-responsive transcriptional regulator